MQLRHSRLLAVTAVAGAIALVAAIPALAGLELHEGRVDQGVGQQDQGVRVHPVAEDRRARRDHLHDHERRQPAARLRALLEAVVQPLGDLVHRQEDGADLARAQPPS